MILINLLPPELRRRGAGISPLFASVAGGGVANAVLLALLIYVQFVRIPNAIRVLGDKQNELADKTRQAEEVNQLRAVITEYESRRETILRLLANKMFLARNLDDFATLIAGKWSMPSQTGAMVELPGVDVRALELQIKESTPGTAENRGPSKQQMVSFTYHMKYQILGPETKRSGDYLKAFWTTVERSPFWRGYSQDGFLGKPEDPYQGDQPVWMNDIARALIELSLDWRRVKTVDIPAKPMPRTAPAKPAGAAARERHRDDAAPLAGIASAER